MNVTTLRERPLILTLALILFMHVVDFMLIMPLGPQLMRTLSITPKQFGIVVSSYIFSASAMGLLAAAFIDRFDYKKSLLVLYFGMMLGNLACGLSQTYEVLVLARIITGGFGGVLSGLCLAIVSDVVPGPRRGAAIGLVMASFPSASVLGVPIGLYFGTHWDWHMPFLILAGLGVPVLAMSYYVLPSMKKHPLSPIAKHPLRTITDLFTAPENVRGLLLFAVLGLSSFSVIPFLSPYLVANGGIAEADLVYTYFAGGACNLFAMPFIGRCADRFGKYRVFLITAIISIIPIAIVTNLQQISLFMGMFITTFFMIFVSGRAVTAMSLISITVKPSIRSSFMSLNSSVQQFSSGIASFMAGNIIVKSATGQLLHYNVVGYISVAATLLSLYLGSRLIPLKEEL
ncbi:MAG: MFS transporter [Oligoflexia bacterium]|nr:MFS transporter [Oligoflexia bacterium]